MPPAVYIYVTWKFTILSKYFNLFLVHEKIELLNDKIERDTFDKPGYDYVDFDNNLSNKVLTKKRNYSAFFSLHVYAHF